MNASPHNAAERKNERELRLIERVAKEDREALAELYRLYHPRLFKFIFRLTRSYETSEELVNDILLQVWRGASAFRGDSRVSTWILGIAYRMAMRHVSRRKLRLNRDLDPDELTADTRNRMEAEDWVQHGLSQLPAAQQTTVLLVFYLGLSYEETAQVTDCPVNTVKSRMFHARKKLRLYLETSAGITGTGTTA